MSTHSEKVVKANPSVKENNVAKEIIKKVQQVYSQFEKGEIDQRGFKKTLTEDLRINTSKLDDIFKSAKEDNKDFKSIVQSLGISNRATYHPGFSNEEITKSTDKKFPRYIKEKAANTIKTPMHTNSNLLGDVDSYDHHNERKEKLQQVVNDFVHGYIDSKSFEVALRARNINPEVEEINKHLRTSNLGSANYKDLMISIMKYQDSKYSNDPNKINHVYRKLNMLEHQKFDDDLNSIVVMTGNEPVHIKKKKKVDNNPNLVSQKDVYDWEAEDGLAQLRPQESKSSKRDPNFRYTDSNDNELKIPIHSDKRNKDLKGSTDNSLIFK